jgi:hypothetical protein
MESMLIPFPLNEGDKFKFKSKMCVVSKRYPTGFEYELLDKKAEQIGRLFITYKYWGTKSFPRKKWWMLE